MNADLIFVWLFMAAQVVISLVYCFWGYRYFRLVMSLNVFMFVFPVAFSIISGFTSMSQPIAILIAIVISFLAALLTWFVYKLAIFLCGGLAGILIAYWLSSTLGADYKVLCIILGIVLFILLGMLALKFQKVIVILISSISGGFKLVTYVLYIIMNYATIGTFSILSIDSITSAVSASYSPQAVYIIPSVIFAVTGIIIQSRITAKGMK